MLCCAVTQANASRCLSHARLPGPAISHLQGCTRNTTAARTASAVKSCHQPAPSHVAPWSPARRAECRFPPTRRLPPLPLLPLRPNPPCSRCSRCSHQPQDACASRAPVPLPLRAATRPSGRSPAPAAMASATGLTAPHSNRTQPHAAATPWPELSGNLPSRQPPSGQWEIEVFFNCRLLRPPLAQLFLVPRRGPGGHIKWRQCF